MMWWICKDLLALVGYVGFIYLLALVQARLDFRASPERIRPASVSPSHAAEERQMADDNK